MTVSQFKHRLQSVIQSRADGPGWTKDGRWNDSDVLLLGNIEVVVTPGRLRHHVHHFCIRRQTERGHWTAPHVLCEGTDTGLESTLRESAMAHGARVGSMLDLLRFPTINWSIPVDGCQYGSLPGWTIRIEGRNIYLRGPRVAEIHVASRTAGRERRTAEFVLAEIGVAFNPVEYDDYEPLGPKDAPVDPDGIDPTS